LWWPLAAIVIVVVLPLASLFVGAWLSGWRVQVVETESMEPTVPAGSAIVVEPIDASDVRVGMPIAFADESRGGRMVTHRVVEIVDRPAGGQAFRTQGDANDSPDAQLVAGRAIRGRMRWPVPYLGSALRWLRWPFGFLALVVMPLVALVVAEALAYARRRLVRKRRQSTELPSVVGSNRVVADGEVLRALPETYGLALRLRAEGLAAPAIGRVLDIESESVGPLIDLGEAKLARLRSDASAPIECSLAGS